MLPTPTYALKPLDYLQGEFVNRKIHIDEGIKELCNSLISNGFLQPIGAIDFGSYGEQLFGGRRIAAYRYGLEQGLAVPSKIPMLLYPQTLTTTQRRVITTTENLQRVDLTDPEIFTACSELMKLNPEWQRKDLAAHLSKDPSTVTRYLSPSDLVPEALAAFMAAEFGFAKAYSIAKSPDQLVTLSLVRGGETRDGLERRTRKAKASSAPAVRSSSLRFPISTGHVVAIKGDEISLEEAVEVLSTALKDVKRGIADHLTAKTFQSAARDKAAAG